MGTRSSGSGIVLDLNANGANSVQAAPGSTVQFILPAPKLSANGNYPRACRICVRVQGVVDNNQTGHAAIAPSEIARIVSNFNTRCPLEGTMHNSDTFTGPVTKHVAEFLSGGYNYYGGNLGPGIADNTAAGPLDITFALPFSHEAFFSPLDFAPWVGWLAQLQLDVTLAPSTVFDSLSTGAVISGNLTVTAWIEAVPTKKLVLPTFNQFRAYQPPAAGSTNAQLQNVGASGGLSCVVPGSRVAAILEMMSGSGLGGASTEANYTQFSSDQLNQPNTLNLTSFVQQFQMLARNGGVGAFRQNAAGAVAPNNSGPPRNEAGTLMYYPWRVPGADSEIGSAQKFMGNLMLWRNFTTPPSSGQFNFITNELRQLSEESMGAFLQAAGVSQERADAMRRDYYDGKPTKNGAWGLPVTVPNGR